MHTFQQLWRAIGFVPEAYDLGRDRIADGQHGYFLRPEMVESLMYLRQATKVCCVAYSPFNHLCSCNPQLLRRIEPTYSIYMA